MTSGFRPGHLLPFDYILPVMLGFAYERLCVIVPIWCNVGVATLTHYELNFHLTVL